MSDTTMQPQAPARAPGRTRRTGGRPGNAPPQSGGAVYGLGMVGALVYFAGSAESGRDYLMAFGKAMVWPALLVYRAFRRLDE